MIGDASQDCLASATEPVLVLQDACDPRRFQVHMYGRGEEDFVFRFCELLMEHNFELLSGLAIAESGATLAHFGIRRHSSCREAADAAARLGAKLQGVVGGPEPLDECPRDHDAATLQKLSISPDLFSVSSFREVEPTRPKELAYQLEVHGLNQTGLLAYLSFIMLRSGFVIRRLRMQEPGQGCSVAFELATARGTNAHKVLRTYLDVPVPRSRERTCSASSFFSARRASRSLDGLLWTPCEDASELLHSPGEEHEKSTTASVGSSAGSRRVSPGGSYPSEKSPGRTELQQHVINLPNGDVYKGECQDNGDGLRQQGQGTYWYHGQAQATFKQYTGHWSKGKKHGQGVLLLNSGGSYAGEWRDNKMHGNGVMYDYAEGTSGSEMPSYSYEGEWHDDCKEGLGVEEKDDAVYFGRFLQGRPHGTGVRVRFVRGVLLGCEALDGSSWSPLLDALAEKTAEFDPPEAPAFSRAGGAGYLSVAHEEGADLEAGFRREARQTSLKWMSSPQRSPQPSPKLGPRPPPMSPGGGLSAPASPSMDSKETSGKAPVVEFQLDGLEEPEFELNGFEEPAAKAAEPPPATEAATVAPAAAAQAPTAAEAARALLAGVAGGAAAAKSPAWLAAGEGSGPSPRRAGSRRHSHRRQSTTDSDPSLAALAASKDIKKIKQQRTPLKCPMLWSEDELAAFLSCLGIGQAAVNMVRQCPLRGPDHMLCMSDAELGSRCGLRTPGERHVVRRALTRFLEIDRHENAIRGRRSVEATEDPHLREFLVPLADLSLGPEISAGGFGQVFRGVLRPSDDRGRLRKGQPRTVAVKDMKGDQRMRLNEVLKESRVMATLDHANLCSFIGICTDGRSKGGTQYILSELMDCSLFDLVHKPHRLKWEGTLNVVCALSISAGVCRGLGYLHSKNLVHADLKSPNVLIDFTARSHPTPRICDFGHAVLRTHPAPHSRCGTPHWAAPEALRNEAVGPAADVFSWGVLLWEMLAKAVPHKSLTFGQVAGAVGWQGWVPDEQELPELPQDLRRLMQQCWSFDPGERPSVADVQKKVRMIRRQPCRDARDMLAAFLGSACQCMAAQPLKGKCHTDARLPTPPSGARTYCDSTKVLP